MKRFLYLTFFIITVIAGFLIINNCLAYSVSDISTFTGQTREGAGLSELEYTDIASGVINVMLSVVGAIFVILIIFSGFTWMTSQGNQEKVDKAKKTLFYAVAGLVIVMASYSIASIIITAIEQAPETPLTGGPTGYDGGGGDVATTCSGSGLQCVPSILDCQSSGSTERFPATWLTLDCVNTCAQSTTYDGTCAGQPTKSKCENNSACAWGFAQANLDLGAWDLNINSPMGSCDWKCNFQVCCKSVSNPCMNLGVVQCLKNDNVCEWVPSASGVGGECLLQTVEGY